MPMARCAIEDSLRALGAMDDAEIDLAEAALLLAAIDRPDAGLDRYRAHLEEVARDVGIKVPSGAAHNVARRIRALADIISDAYGYVGDTLTYDDPQNANLMRVIDRRKGLPVALGILYIHAARAQGWSATGINFPGHFLIRLERGGVRVIADPFNGGVERKVADLRALLKQMAGLDAELRPDHYQPISNRDTLIRLLNNIKLRALSADKKMTGINFPGHFLIRLERGGVRVIADPFNGGVERKVADLRALLKQMAGLDAELRPDHYQPISNRDTLIRLLNNIKLRALSAGDGERAAEILDRMLMIAPHALAVLREAGACHAQIGNMRRAIEVLESFVALSADDASRREAAALLHQVRARLN